MLQGDALAFPCISSYTFTVNIGQMTYLGGDTPVHRCDARVKIVALFVCSTVVCFAQTWWGLGTFSAAVAVLAAIAKIPLRRMLVPLVPVFVLAAFAVVFAPEKLAGLFNAVRMVALVAASFIVCYTTTSTDLLKAFAWLIRPLRHVKVPVGDIAFTLSLALRFIPVIADELASVRAAQLARGGGADGMPFTRKLSVWGAAFSAVFVGLFRRADVLASALDARCYGNRDKR